MTFYWWSHWFWITLLGNILLSIVIVHAYPSQDVAAEYNNNNNRDPKSTTRLYQTTTTIIWATSAPPPSQKALDGGVAAQEAPVIEGRTAADDEVEDVGVEDEDEDVMEEPEAEPEPESEPGSQSGLLEEEQAEAEEEEEATLEDGDGAAAAGDRSESQEFEYKRSADDGSANGTRPQVESASDGMQVAPEGVEGAKGGQAEAKNSTRQEKELHVTDAHSNYSNFSANPMPSTNGPGLKTAGSSPSPGSPPAAVGGPSTAEWLGSIVQAVADPASAAEDRSDSDPVAGEKAPFTLENVNKAEEIVRAENEHRSRKSKVLSAEYRHTDRFINYSTESKNLLARSASTAPNEFDGDEGNISSEALAIQRTYFLDASAISAICFAVFGICCTVGTIGIVLYRRRYLNKPQALSEPDSSVYIDDSTMRDNSDEMYSLDNDSFLNSLEAMTIQNYWTDTVKHTKL